MRQTVSSNSNIKEPLIIGIAGGSGAGKTTFSQALHSALKPQSSFLLKIDDYYRDLSDMPYEQRKRVNFDHPDALDMGMLAEHLSRLKEFKPIKKPVYNFNNHCRSDEYEKVEPHNIIIAEGILLFIYDFIRNCIEFKIFLDVSTDKRFDRRMTRDVSQRNRTPKSVKKQYYSTVEPMYKLFVDPSKQHADLVLRDGDMIDWTKKVMSELNLRKLL